MTFPERLEAFIKENRTSQKAVAEYAGVRYASISDWKKDGSYPRADIAIKIAKMLGTTAEYLVTGKLPEGITEEDQKLIVKFHRLDPSDKKEVMKFIDFVLLQAEIDEENEYYQSTDNGEIESTPEEDWPKVAYQTNNKSIPIRNVPGKGRPKKAKK
jgi:transcriptional regulator with XRE-family HTH domain